VERGSEAFSSHLIRLLEMGRCELNHTAVLYVVMEYAEENLSLVIARRPLAPAEARVILGPVVKALSDVHVMGFVHCRLKPANIMADDDLLKISSDGLCVSVNRVGARESLEPTIRPKHPAEESHRLAMFGRWV